VAIRNKAIDFILDINKDVFEISLITYLVFLLIEELKEGFISYNFNLNILLGLVIVSGILTIFSKAKTNKHELETNLHESRIRESRISKKDWIFIIGLGILGGFLIFYKTKELGWLSLVISIISGILIVLLSVLILEENDGNETNLHQS